MTENKNLNHTFSSDVNMPLYLICFGSLYPLNNSVKFFFGGGGGGGGGGAVVICSHTVDVSVRLVVLLFFSVHAIFDDPVKVIL